MTSSEKRKPKSIRNETRDPVAGFTEQQLLKLRQASGQPGNMYPTGTDFRKSAQRSETADIGMLPFTGFPDALEGDNAFVFYPSGGHPSEADRPNLVDAVIEQLRLAKLKRQRSH